MRRHQFLLPIPRSTTTTTMRCMSEMINNRSKIITQPMQTKSDYVDKSSTSSSSSLTKKQKGEEISHEIIVKRGTKVDQTTSGLTGTPLNIVNKITFSKNHVVQQSANHHNLRGDVMDHTEAGVPMVVRDPDVARPTSYVSDADITDSYFELPEGFNREKHFFEIFRENWSIATYLSLGLASYWYYWPQLYGWGPTLSFITVVQAFLARYGGGHLVMRNSHKATHPLLLPDSVMRDKICLVTGGSSGVGLMTAIGLARRGANVIIGAQRPEAQFWLAFNKALPGSLSNEQREEISKRISYQSVDMAEFHSIRSFVEFVQDRLFLHAKALGRIPIVSMPSSASTENVADENGNIVKNNTNKKTKIDVRKERAAAEEKQQEFLRMYPPPLDILVNNAATLTNAPKYNSLNFELMLATNVLGPMFLTELLMPNIRAATKQTMADYRPRFTSSVVDQPEAKGSDKKTTSSSSGQIPSPFGRVVNVTSMAHVAITDLGNVQKNLLQKTFDKTTFNFNKRYALTKLLNIYYSDGLARRGVRSVSATPGGVASSFFRENMPSIQPGNWAHYPSLVLLRTPNEGAQTILAACLAKTSTTNPKENHFIPGVLFTNCRKREHAKSAVALNDRERGEFLDWAKGQLPIKGFDEEVK